MKLSKTVRDRCKPIIEKRDDGSEWIIGYKRNSRSRKTTKAGMPEEWKLNKPILHKEAPAVVVATEAALAEKPLPAVVTELGDKAQGLGRRMANTLSNIFRRKK